MEAAKDGKGEHLASERLLAEDRWANFGSSLDGDGHD